MPAITIATPTGLLTVTEANGAVTRIEWRQGHHQDDTPVLRQARTQIDAYFAGTRREFDLALQVNGSDFQRAVCDAMRAIPFGETRTYGEIAKALGQSAQAVGGACGGNPIPIIIPCHRVLGAGGRLTGFSGAGGVETKVALLRHEGAASLLI